MSLIDKEVSPSYAYVEGGLATRKEDYRGHNEPFHNRSRGAEGRKGNDESIVEQ